jgi:hypothetical protein
MKLINPTRQPRPTTRRQRFISVAVEATEKRLTLSSILPQTPPIAASMVANYPQGPLIPSGPCYPSGPVASQVANHIPTGPCFPIRNGAQT